MDSHTPDIIDYPIVSDGTNTSPIIKRRFTNRYFLLLQIIGTVFLMILVNYCMKYGDLRRIINGYDSCRNLCGEVNNMDDLYKKSWCDGLDMSYRRYLLVFKPDGRNHYNATRLYERHNDVVVPITLQDNVQRVCLVNCSVYQNYYQYKNRCILKKSKTVADIFWGKSGIPDFLLEVAEDIVTYWPAMVYIFGISIVLSMVITILFRFKSAVAIWVVLTGLIIVCLVTMIYTWVMWDYWNTIVSDPEYLAAELEVRRCHTYLIFAIIYIFLTICAVVVTCIVKRRIDFILRLFTETTRAVLVIPLMLLQPLVTTIFIGGVVGISMYFFLWIETAGHEVELYDDFYEFQKDSWIYFTRCYNLFIALWSIQFLIGCQHTVLSGAVSVWYFANNKNILGSPIFYALYNLVRYHIGSVSCGSIAILMAQLFNGCCNLLKRISKNHEFHKSWYCHFPRFEAWLKNFTRNAYIEIALYGDTFYTAGKNYNAALKTNAFSIAEINSMGYFILFLTEFFISLLAMLIAIFTFQEKEDLQHAWILIILLGWLAYLASYCFLSIYEIAMDTTLVCFCEDSEQHQNKSKHCSLFTRELLTFIAEIRPTSAVLHTESFRDVY